MANNLISTVELIEKANTVLSKHSKLLSQSAIDAEKLNKAYGNLPSQYIKSLKSIDENQNKIIKSTNELEKASAKQKAQMDKMFADRQKQMTWYLCLQTIGTQRC